MNDEAGSVEASVRGRETLAERTARAVSAYRDGNKDELSDLVTLLTPLLWHTVRAQGASREQAEDLVQNVWLTLVREVDSIRDPRAALQWLLVTARRSAWRTVQRSRDEAARESMHTDALGWLAGPVDDRPGQALERDERDAVLWRHVGSLPERCRRLLGLVALVDRPDYVEVSRSLGMPVGSIGPTRGRCLAKLRLALAADPRWSTT